MARFKSGQYPTVGIYTSPLLSKLLFIGAESPDSVSFCTSTSIFRCETSDLRLDQFLQSEKSLTLTDVLCDSCYRAAGDCPSCRRARSDSTLIELDQDLKIKDALKLEQVSGEGKSLKQRFIIEYPTHSDLNEVYTEQNCNERMALQSSKSLRKKLIKNGKIHEFHDKVVDSVTKGHVAVMTPKMKRDHENLPRSYQLINYVVKESSASTKLRVVTNSSAPRRGGSYNEQTMKGSFLIASAPEVLFGFSAHCFALMTDLQEAYRSTRTGPVTNSCRRSFGGLILMMNSL